MTELTPEHRAELRAAVTEDPSPMGSTWWPISGPSVLALLDAADERDRLAELVERVRALTYVSDDGTRYGHDGHSPIDGYPECPGCWSDGILATLDGADDE